MTSLPPETCLKFVVPAEIAGQWKRWQGAEWRKQAYMAQNKLNPPDQLVPPRGGARLRCAGCTWRLSRKERDRYFGCPVGRRRPGRGSPFRSSTGISAGSGWRPADGPSMLPGSAADGRHLPVRRVPAVRGAAHLHWLPDARPPGRCHCGIMPYDLGYGTRIHAAASLTTGRACTATGQASLMSTRGSSSTGSSRARASACALPARRSGGPGRGHRHPGHRRPPLDPALRLQHRA